MFIARKAGTGSAEFRLESQRLVVWLWVVMASRLSTSASHRRPLIRGGGEQGMEVVEAG